MMGMRHLFFLILHLGFSYATIYYFLFSIKNKVNLQQASLIILVLFSLAVLTCPLMGMPYKIMHWKCMIGHVCSM